jgi:spore coat protein A, manganese oxidase
MISTRRDFLKTSTLAAGAAVPLDLNGLPFFPPLPRTLPSRVPLPPKFAVDLPLLPVLKSDSQENGIDRYEVNAKAAMVSIVPGFKTAVWGYNGSFPGPTIEARSGHKTLFRLRNELPVPIVNHLHGGHTPPESDGYPTDLILPDADWIPLQDHDPFARIAVASRDYVYPNEQRAATLWYHDHRMDFTGPQMWRGLAGFYILRDEEEDRLPLPRGEKEIALMLSDRSFDSDGALLYPSLDDSLRNTPSVHPAYMGGVMGDVMLVNGAPWPRLEVANTLYRFRILNACNARHLELALNPAPIGGPTLVQIGSDGGLLAIPVPHATLSISPGERFDIIVDFGKYPLGTKVVLENKQSRDATGELMRFEVMRQEKERYTVPNQLTRIEKLDPGKAVTTRTFDFRYGGMKRGWVINGKPFDPVRLDATPKLGAMELWRLRTDLHHPLHLHLAHFQVLTHSGHPRSYDAGWKDTLDMAAGETAEVLVRFDSYQGRYVFHCHNLEHEDMAMMGNFEVM